MFVQCWPIISHFETAVYSLNKERWARAILMLFHRLRRCPNIKPTLFQRAVFIWQFQHRLLSIFSSIRLPVHDFTRCFYNVLSARSRRVVYIYTGLFLFLPLFSCPYGVPYLVGVCGTCAPRTGDWQGGSHMRVPAFRGGLLGSIFVSHGAPEDKFYSSISKCHIMSF